MTASCGIMGARGRGRLPLPAQINTFKNFWALPMFANCRNQCCRG
jgi:hypothetical protein